jgi:hypothetical protein
LDDWSESKHLSALSLEVDALVEFGGECFQFGERVVIFGTVGVLFRGDDRRQ